MRLEHVRKVVIYNGKIRAATPLGHFGAKTVLMSSIFRLKSLLYPHVQPSFCLKNTLSSVISTTTIKINNFWLYG